MNSKTFFIWVWISIYQGIVIMVMSLLMFEQSFVRIVTITFTALILSEILNVLTTIHQINRYIIGSQLLTVLLYWLSLIFFRNYLDTSRIDRDFLYKVGLIVAVSWTPIYIARCLRRRLAPSEEDKITNHWLSMCYHCTLLLIYNWLLLFYLKIERKVSILILKEVAIL